MTYGEPAARARYTTIQLLRGAVVGSLIKTYRHDGNVARAHTSERHRHARGTTRRRTAAAAETSKATAVTATNIPHRRSSAINHHHTSPVPATHAAERPSYLPSDMLARSLARDSLILGTALITYYARSVYARLNTH